MKTLTERAQMVDSDREVIGMFLLESQDPMTYTPKEIALDAPTIHELKQLKERNGFAGR